MVGWWLAVAGGGRRRLVAGELWTVANGRSAVSCLSVDLTFVEKPSNRKGGKPGSNSATLARGKNTFSTREWASVWPKRMW